MNADRWPQLEDLFHGALALPPDRWHDWLERMTDDAEIRVQVLRLLAADARADGVLESVVSTTAWSATCEAQRTDRVIGRYRLLRELGRGGSGAVHLAKRIDGSFEQSVAIKLVRQSLTGDLPDRQLVAEREILARLNHPNIARLLDGGATADGMPYFVMEVIDGLPIDVYCDRNRLGVDDRLRLICTVCEAVHYAHRNLIVHRDLKPSNVLVQADGTPKLLDFGIAKLLQPDQGGLAAVTLFRMGTPGYASPEQILGLPITTASDVFSLGVLLYELLTGTPPFRIEECGGLHEVERAIVESTPEPPSSMARQRSFDRAAQLRERPESLARRLRGDLDTIITIALRKEPTRRYGSAQQLSDELQRHLAGLPIAARSDTLSYRSAKFLRRHRLGVSAAVVAIAAVLTLAATMVVQATRAAQQRDRAEQVSTMLIRLFEVAGPSADRGSDLTARELLDRGRAELDTLRGQPETQALLLLTLGGLYERLGLFDEARHVFDDALTVRRALHGDRHPQIAEALHKLARATARGGDYIEAERLFRRALDMRRELLGEDHPDVAVGLNSLALVLHEVGDHAAADSLYRRALEKSLRLHGRNHPQSIKTQANLALLRHDQGDHRTAVELFRSTLLLAQAQPNQDDMIDEIIAGLALSLHALDDPQAEHMAREALQRRERRLGTDHPLVARSQAHLGRILIQSDPATAEVLIETALELRLRLLGENNAETAENLALLAALRVRQARFVEADALYGRAVEALRRDPSPRPHLLAAPVLEWARSLLQRGSCPAARELLRSADDLPLPYRALATRMMNESGCRPLSR